MRRLILTDMGMLMGSLLLPGFLTAAPLSGRAGRTQADNAESKDKARQPEVESVTVAVYSCPGHVSIRQDASGKCPECGRDLQEKQVAVYRVKDAGGAKAGPGRYVCPAHPDVRSKKPGRCSHDGTRLVREDMLN
ncbi:MAG: heavy metal-binding domain-containing protein [Endomicrobiales bacterium]